MEKQETVKHLKLDKVIFDKAQEDLNAHFDNFIQTDWRVFDKLQDIELYLEQYIPQQCMNLLLVAFDNIFTDHDLKLKITEFEANIYMWLKDVYIDSDSSTKNIESLKQAILSWTDEKKDAVM